MSKFIFYKQKCKTVGYLNMKHDESVDLINLQIFLHTTYFDVCIYLFMDVFTEESMAFTGSVLCIVLESYKTSCPLYHQVKVVSKLMIHTPFDTFDGNFECIDD